MKTVTIILIILLSLLIISWADDEKSEAAVDSLVGDSSLVAVTTPLPKMVDLGAKTCKACKKMMPILDSLETAYKDKAEIVFIDIREDKSSLRKYGITLIPTQVFYDTAGNETFRHIGFYPADSIEYRLNQAGMK